LGFAAAGTPNKMVISKAVKSVAREAKGLGLD
jgi:hypothetical protein